MFIGIHFSFTNDPEEVVEWIPIGRARWPDALRPELLVIRRPFLGLIGIMGWCSILLEHVRRSGHDITLIRGYPSTTTVTGNFVDITTGISSRSELNQWSLSAFTSNLLILLRKDHPVAGPEVCWLSVVAEAYTADICSLIRSSVHGCFTHKLTCTWCLHEYIYRLFSRRSSFSSRAKDLQDLSGSSSPMYLVAGWIQESLELFLLLWGLRSAENVVCSFTSS